MKRNKLAAILLACGLLLGFAACSSGDPAEPAQESSSSVTASSESASSEAPVVTDDIQVVEDPEELPQEDPSSQEEDEEEEVDTGGDLTMDAAPVAGIDAAGYVKAIMDAEYLNQTQSYQEMIGASQEEAALVFEDTVAYATQSLLYQYDCLGASEATQARIGKFFRALFPQAKYQVTGAQAGDGLFSVTVAINPINVFSAHVDEISSYMDKAAGKSHDDFMNGLMDLVESYPVSYGDPQNIIINVVSSAGSWQLSAEDQAYLDATVIMY